MFSLSQKSFQKSAPAMGRMGGHFRRPGRSLLNKRIIMPLFEPTIEISLEKVQDALDQHYFPRIVLQNRIKASQNHTFEAVNENGEKFAVRATPLQPAKNTLKRVQNEVDFVSYLANSRQLNYVCGPIQTKSGDMIAVEENLILVVSDWAKGEPINFIAYEWLHDEALIFDWGKWFAKYHKLSREYCLVHREKVREFQKWDEIHNGILQGVELCEDDIKASSDPNEFGIIHGDLNLSNFFYLREERTLSVFDWDQTQRSWYLFDISQALLAVVMLQEAGSVIEGKAIPGIDFLKFENTLVAGYESVAGLGSVNRSALSRMLGLRLSFYEKFCRQAIREGDIPPDMEPFIRYIVGWFDHRH